MRQKVVKHKTLEKRNYNNQRGKYRHKNELNKGADETGNTREDKMNSNRN